MDIERDPAAAPVLRKTLPGLDPHPMTDDRGPKNWSVVPLFVYRSRTPSRSSSPNQNQTRSSLVGVATLDTWVRRLPPVQNEGSARRYNTRQTSRSFTVLHCWQWN